MALNSLDSFIARVANGFYLTQPIVETAAAAATLSLSSSQLGGRRVGVTTPMPASLPTGVTAFIPTRIAYTQTPSNRCASLLRLIDWGTLNISTNVWSKSPSVAVPTGTVLGTASYSVPMQLFILIDVVLSATPGTLSVTHNLGTTTAALVGAGSVNSGGFLGFGAPEGVTSVTTFSRTGGTTPTGTVHLYAAQTLCIWTLCPTQAVENLDLLNNQFNPIRLGINDLIIGFLPSGSAAACMGDIYIVGDN